MTYSVLLVPADLPWKHKSKTAYNPKFQAPPPTPTIQYDGVWKIAQLFPEHPSIKMKIWEFIFTDPYIFKHEDFMSHYAKRMMFDKSLRPFVARTPLSRIPGIRGIKWHQKIQWAYKMREKKAITNAGYESA